MSTRWNPDSQDLECLQLAYLPSLNYNFLFFIGNKEFSSHSYVFLLSSPLHVSQSWPRNGMHLHVALQHVVLDLGQEMKRVSMWISNACSSTTAEKWYASPCRSPSCTPQPRLRSCMHLQVDLQCMLHDLGQGMVCISM